MSRLPLIVILGSTGSGKTKLSLELAKKFGGEILGADSMQVYKGLDVITAKATKEEQSVASHHLIDILEPNEICTVIDYRNKALKIIDDLLKNEKLPIVVGGTNYYIESLLWKILIEDPEGDETNVFKPGLLPENQHILPSEELHNKLKELDPLMAERLHPCNKRKIIRALEVFYKKKRKLSDILKEQQSAEDSSTSGGGLRFNNSLVLWLQTDQEILDKRLDDRVDGMIEQGLVQELMHFHKTYNEERLADDNEPDYTKGIFQSIGFKEFHPYLMLNQELQRSEKGQQNLFGCITQLKMVTRRYAKKQKKWIIHRFLGRSDRKTPPVYGLDTSDVTKWSENVSEVAEEIVANYIANTACKYQPLPKQKTNSTPNSQEESHTCTICERVFVGDYQWQLHLKSNRHKKRLEKKRKNEQQLTSTAEN